MHSISRRRFVQGTAAMPLALWLSRNGFAQSATPLVRRDVATPEGADMLATFANAMRTMLAKPDNDPTSWLWQWYTHFVNGATTKANEMTRIFGDASTPQSALASEMWNTCQSHSGQNTNHFLPWHRMYTLFFEKIVRDVSGRADFALPYWDYTSPDPAKRGVVPVQFRMPNDPVFGVLYRPDRVSLANSGQPIQKNQAGDPMDITTTMACANYSTVGSVQGFCRSVDSGIHGRIHVLVGNTKNMGAVPYAARDPLFWMHHSSIDRIWASWNANGGTNPSTATWAKNSFVFADPAGQRVSSRLLDYFDTTPLGYAYDSLIPAPAAPSAKTASTTTARAPLSATAERVAATTGMASLGTNKSGVTLRAVSAAKVDGPILGLAKVPAQRSLLVLKNLHTWKQPGVLYHVYLTPPHGGMLNRNTYVGAIQFFDAEFHDHGGGSWLDTALGENFFSFDVTELLRRYARSGASARDALQVTFVPGGSARADAGAMVASIELVRQ